MNRSERIKLALKDYVKANSLDEACQQVVESLTVTRVKKDKEELTNEQEQLLKRIKELQMELKKLKRNAKK